MWKREKNGLDIVTLNVRVPDFSSKKRMVSECRFQYFQNFDIYFCATVSTNDDYADEEEGWLSVYAGVNVFIWSKRIKVCDLKWSASIIDNEGNSKFTQYFVCLSEVYNSELRIETFDESSFTLRSYKNLDKSKTGSVIGFCQHDSVFQKLEDVGFLKKEFLLERADELLSNDTLILRCNIFFDFNGIKNLVSNHNYFEQADSLSFFLVHIFDRQVHSLLDTYDLNNHILNFPQFDEMRKIMEDRGLPIGPMSSGTEGKKYIREILEHVWIFDTPQNRFLLSLDKDSDSVGYRLVNASPVIRRCVNAPMKEKREKRIELPDVTSLTFFRVLRFLEKGFVTKYSFDETIDTYKFAHMYEMKILHQKCSELIAKTVETETLLKDFEKIAELYSDDYLLELLNSRRREIWEYSNTSVSEGNPITDYYVK